jgi:hypothetical protein
MLDFRLPHERHSWATDVQRDKYWEKSGGKFTVNVGVGISTMDALLWPAPQNSPRLPTTSVRVPVLATGKDRWWQVSKWSRLSRVAGEAAEQWQEHGLRWLEQYGHPAAIGDWFLQQGNPWLAALAQAGIGKVEAARALYRQSLSRESAPPDHVSYRLDIACRAGIIDDHFVQAARAQLFHGTQALVDSLDPLFAALPPPTVMRGVG